MKYTDVNKNNSRVDYEEGSQTLNVGRVSRNFDTLFKPLECRVNYIATSNDMKLTH